MIGAGLAGPRRIKAGGARDHLLGAHAVSGFGDSFKAGGKVVKNVTGYDLCKLLAGSWGTLAVMTEVTLKVMPRPESERTLVLRGLDDIAANRAMTAALGSPFDVSGAAHLPNSAFRAAQRRLGELGSPRQAVTLLRLEGITASAPHRAASLAQALGVVRSGARSSRTRPRRRSGVRFATSRRSRPAVTLGAWPVWRIVCPPASGGALGQALARDTRRRGDLRLGRRADLGGAAAASPMRRPRWLRTRVNAAGGHATLIRASGSRCARNVDVFHPQPGGLAALGERVRHSFDPKNILNRGRMTRRRACDMKTEFSLGAARRSRYRGGRQDPARLRALRVLHRDLSDLCAARRRTR